MTRLRPSALWWAHLASLCAVAALLCGATALLAVLARRLLAA